MSQIRGLLPTPEVLGEWQIIEDARKWAALNEEVHKKFLAYLGDSELSNLPLLASIGPMVVRRAIGDTRPGEGEGRECTPIEKSRIGLLYNAVRCKFGLELVDVVSVQVTGVGATQALPEERGVPSSENPLLKVKLSTVLDQSSDAEVQLLPAETLFQKRSTYRMAMGGDPLERHNFTDTQLSALSRRVAGGGVPYADFAVWGPYGSRIERKMKFKSSFRDAAGNWRIVECPGPATFEVWEECWEVFKAAAIADGIASPATLDIYSAEFRSRCKEYAKCWHLCVEADVIARSEQLVLERRKQESFHAVSPQASNYNPLQPWNSVIRAVALDTAFWDRVLESRQCGTS